MIEGFTGRGARLAEMLFKEGKVTHLQASIALRVAERWRSTLSHALAKLGYMAEWDIVEFLSRKYDVPAVDLKQIEIDPEAVHLLPKRMAKKYGALIISCRDGKIEIVTIDPTNIFAMDDIAFLTGYERVPLMSSEKAIREAIETWYGPEIPGPKTRICFDETPEHH